MFFSCEDEDIGKIKIKIIFPSPSKYCGSFMGMFHPLVSFFVSVFSPFFLF